jgi:hypothetical protein
MDIDILGWYGAGNNCGDTSFKKFIISTFRHHQLNFVTPPAKCNADIIVLGGGAIIAPYYLSSLDQATCPKYALGVSISYLSEMDLVKDTFKHLYLRDPSDVEEMRSKVNYPVDPIPDLSFFHTPSGGDIIKKYAPCDRRKSLGVLLTDYVAPALDRSFEEFGTRAHSFRVNLAEELTMLYRDGWDIYFIPLSTGGYGNDIRENLDVTAWMRETPIQIYDTLSPQDAIDLIAQMDLTLCMKYHSVLFSVIAGVPFVSMAFTRKVDLFLQEHDLKKYIGAKFIDNKEFDATNLRKVVDDAMGHKTELRSKFVHIADGYYSELHKIAGVIRRDWLGE